MLAPFTAMRSTSKRFRVDPTRTTAVRRDFTRDIERRWREIKRDLRTTIVENDCFGLQEQPHPRLSLIPAVPLVRAAAAAPPRAFAFTRSDQKLAGFMDWLYAQTNDKFLEVEERPGGILGRQNVPWSNVYVDSAYKKGITQAQIELQRAGYAVPAETARGFAGYVAQSIHADRLAMLYGRTFEDLKSVARVTEASVRREVADMLATGIARGMAEGKGGSQIAKELYEAIADRTDKIGLSRMRMIAQTEVVRAHHVATISEYRRASEEMQVQVLAECMTAGDDKVCDDCLKLEKETEKKPWTLDEAESRLPAHPY